MSTIWAQSRHATIFDINFLFTILIAALLGGASTIVGPIHRCAFFLTFLLEYLRPYIPGTERYFIYGLRSPSLYMCFEPKGPPSTSSRDFTALSLVKSGSSHEHALLDTPPHLNKRFGGLVAVNELSFHVNEGESRLD